MKIKNQAGSADLGSLLISATSSLPLHVMPVLLAAVVSQGILPLTLAGLMPATLAVGQIVSCFLLGISNRAPNSRLSIALTFLLILFGLFLAAHINVLWIFTGWFLVGLGCGALHQYGIVISAESKNASSSLATRLAFVLMLSGLVVLLSKLFSQNYFQYLLLIGMSFLLIGLGVLSNYGGTKAPALPSQDDEEPIKSRINTGVGLMIALCFFIGQPGFWQFSVHTSQVNGIDYAALLTAVAGGKCFSAIVLWLVYRSSIVRHLQTGWMLLLATICTISMVAMTHAKSAIIFFIAMLFWEITFNVISPKLQGTVLELNQQFCKRWLGLTILLGMALGPALHSYFQQHQSGYVFLIFAGLTPFLVLIVNRLTPNALAQPKQ